MTKFSDIGDKDAKLMGHLMLIVSKVANQQGLANGYRTVVNDGRSAGQTIAHLLIHVVGGQQLSWPPFADPKKQENPNKIEE